MSGAQYIENGTHRLVFQQAPVEELVLPAFHRRGLRLLMLRGDLVHPVVSGNKLWKLKYNLLEAIQTKKKRLITFGGAYSNHLLAVACAAASLGFESLGIIRGEEPLDNPVLRQCQLFGMKFAQVTRAQYRRKYETLEQLGLSGTTLVTSTDWVIPEGGSNELALQGCAEVVPSMPLDHIFVPVGTGGTLAGLALAASRANRHARVEGVAVLKSAEFLLHEVKKLALGLKNWKLHLDFHHGGYAKSSPALLDYISEFARTTGILLDPIYTGKMMYALHSLVEDGYFAQGKVILAVHTGGLSGWAGFSSRLPLLKLGEPE